jgi:hypothetical protein
VAVGVGEADGLDVGLLEGVGAAAWVGIDDG